MKQWYLVYCKRGGQAKAKLNLENQGVHCFYPEIKVEKILRGTKQEVNEPLFPSYMFIQFDPESVQFTSIRSTRGVIDFVRVGRDPAKVPVALIEELKQLDGQQEETLCQTPQQGDSVYVKAGQFAGIEAIFQESDGEKRSFLLVTLISKNVRISIDNKDIDFQS